MPALHNPLVEDFRFPSSAPPLPLTIGGPDVVVQASVRNVEPSQLELAAVTSRGASMRIFCAALRQASCVCG
jgi:hypothetical protein